MALSLDGDALLITHAVEADGGRPDYDRGHARTPVACGVAAFPGDTIHLAQHHDDAPYGGHDLYDALLSDADEGGTLRSHQETFLAEYDTIYRGGGNLGLCMESTDEGLHDDVQYVPELVYAPVNSGLSVLMAEVAELDYGADRLTPHAAAAYREHAPDAVSMDRIAADAWRQELETVWESAMDDGMYADALALAERTGMPHEHRREAAAAVVGRIDVTERPPPVDPERSLRHTVPTDASLTDGWRDALTQAYGLDGESAAGHI